MKRLPAAVVLAILSVFLALPGCAGKVPPPLVNFGVCVEKAAPVNSVITEVETALASNDWSSALANIGKAVGFDVVDCAVQTLVSSLKAKRSAAPSDELSQIKLDHAQAWLART